jgi:hypothetical protein
LSGSLAFKLPKYGGSVPTSVFVIELGGVESLLDLRLLNHSIRKPFCRLDAFLFPAATKKKFEIIRGETKFKTNISLQIYRLDRIGKNWDHDFSLNTGKALQQQAGLGGKRGMRSGS